VTDGIELCIHDQLKSTCTICNGRLAWERKMENLVEMIEEEDANR
jgi:hypothetical protein